MDATQSLALQYHFNPAKSPSGDPRLIRAIVLLRVALDKSRAEETSAEQEWKQQWRVSSPQQRGRAFHHALRVVGINRRALGAFELRAVTGVDLSTGTTRGQHINTDFDDRILPKADSKGDATSLLQEVISRIALLPVELDRVPQGFASSDTSHPEHSSESYVAPLDFSLSQEHTKDGMGTETGKGNLSQKEMTSNFGTGRSVIAGHISETTRHSSSEVTTHDFPTLSQTLAETTSSQSSSQTIGPISVTKTSYREWQDTAISGSNISVGFSKQGVALLLSIVLGGILVLIGIFAIHGFILLRLHKQTGGSVAVRPHAAFGRTVLLRAACLSNPTLGYGIQT
ncbi:unnamed protein product [Penicillium camemberti]|uniref:Str. FM013 n=1 Tax=Penicillium camemberti (strain FM 013) TaxID=1429867 RepID=A0A0G4PW27_PENC3|nr:unnamed protein product [Penicillium camemberti]